MSFLNGINIFPSSEVLENLTLNFNDLETEKFKSFLTEVVNGKFNESILVELEDGIVFPSKRSTEVEENHIKDFAEGV